MSKKKYAFWLISLVLLFIGGCASLPKNSPQPVSFAYNDTGQTRLGRYSQQQTASRPGLSGFVLLENGVDAFAAWLELVDQAERSIDAQYYLFHDDLAGRLLLHHLLQAADRGVRVRLLLDDIDMLGRDQAAAILDLHPNVEFRVFNPFSRNFDRIAQMIFTIDMGRVTRRMHNKSFIVDNQAAILGSRNIGNSYFGADPKLAFQDLDLLAVGPIVEPISGLFDTFWNSSLTCTIATLHPQIPDPHSLTVQRKALDAFLACQESCDFAETVHDAPSADALRRHQLDFYWAPAELIYDQPQKILHHSSDPALYLSPKLLPLFRHVEKEVDIISPYFVPGREGVALLQEMIARGVRVRVLTNSLASTDVSAVHSGYAKYRKDLLNAGVALYELNKNISRKERKERKKRGEQGSSMASLHTKAIIFDQRKVFIGSLNLDPRALEFNTEMGVVLESGEMAAFLTQWLDDNLDQMAFRVALEKGPWGNDKVVWHGIVEGRRESFTKEPYSSVWRRLGVGLMSILPLVGSHL